MKRKRTEITIEIDEMICAASRRPQSNRATCPVCGSEATMVPLDKLPWLSGASGREIFRLVEAGMIYCEATGQLIVCASCHRQLGTH